MKNFIKFFFGKTFSGERFVNSLVANFLGLQIFRYVVGKILYNIKYIFYKDKNFSLQKNGYIVLENFLPDSEFLLLRDEFNLAVEDENFSQKYNDYGQGVEAAHVYLDEKIRNKYHNLYKFSKNKKILSFFTSNELKKKLDMVVKLEKLKTIKNDEDDLSKTFHYDTYYNTFKAWYYLQDVSIEQGPLNYVESSHNFSLARLLIEWKASIKYSLLKNKKDWKGYGASSKKYNYYNNISKKFTVKKNTLIFANTHGLHRRGDSIADSQRNTIHFYTRESPFKIFFG